MNKLSSLLLAASVALALAGCAHNKPETHAAPPPAAQAAGTATSGSSVGNPAQASAAGSNGALSAQAMAGGNSAGAAGKPLSPQQVAMLKTSVFHFDYDSDAIHSADYAALEAHAAWLAATPAARLRVEGNCDERGTREYNMALGERRAKAVAAFLTSHGASAGQLSIISYGKEKPVDPGHDEAAWAKNRRVELHYTSGTP